MSRGIFVLRKQMKILYEPTLQHIQDSVNLSSIVFSICPSNDSDGELGVVLMQDKRVDFLTYSSNNRQNWESKKNRDLEDCKEAALRAKGWFMTDVNKHNQPGLTLTEAKKQISSIPDLVHVNSGTQFKSGASRFNTGKQHVNSGSVHVNSGTQFKSGASRFNTGKQHVNTGRVNRPDHPLKHMEHRGIFDSGCSGHMTGNRAHLEDYQELSKVGSVTFGGSKGSISGKGKFDGKSDEGFLVGYSVNSKAFRIYNLVTKRVEVNLHVNFLEEKPNVQGIGHSGNLNTGFEQVTPGNMEAISPSANPVEEVFSDADDDEMPEIRIYDKSSEGIFEQASFDEDRHYYVTSTSYR
ncbi:hypothetical protein Tco_1509279 [Tanacetum coccineum]